MDETEEEIQTDFVWRCGKLWAHTKMIRESFIEVIQVPEGQKILIEQVESLMGPADHSHIFAFNLGSLTHDSTVYYDCVAKEKANGSVSSL